MGCRGFGTREGIRTIDPGMAARVIFLVTNDAYCVIGVRALSQYPKRRLSVRSRKVSKPRDLYLELSDRSETSAAVLPMCLSNFKAIRQFKVPISWLRNYTRSYEKTSFRILRRGPEGEPGNYKVIAMLYVILYDKIGKSSNGCMIW